MRKVHKIIDETEKMEPLVRIWRRLDDIKLHHQKTRCECRD